MKISVFLLTLVTALTVNAQSKNAICGNVHPDSFIDDETVVMAVFDSAKNDFVEKTVKAVTTSAQDFLSILAVHGGKLCNPDRSNEAPAEICFTGNLKTGQARTIYCSKKRGCTGLHCGGNGFSVNSGSR